MRTLAILGFLLVWGSANAAPAIGSKSLRVMIVSGTMTREAQFLLAILTRAAEAKKAEVTVFVQPLGSEGKPPLLSLPKERVLDKFPADLGVFDTVAVFDLDWAKLGKKNADALKRWTEAGGGLVLVGGPMSTSSLMKEESETARGLFPVVLEEKDAVRGDAPRKLTIAADAGKGVLKLEWDEFFAKGKRGFYGYQPVKEVKKEAKVLASLADPKTKMPSGGEQPFLVDMPMKGGKVVYLASGELWRVREYRDAAHDRLWTQLLAHAAGRTMK